MRSCALIRGSCYPWLSVTTPRTNCFTQAAEFELDEEAHLHQGTWHALLKDGATMAPAGKYSTQLYHAYLVIDPVVKGKPRALDDGEFIEYMRGVSLEEVCDQLRTYVIETSLCGRSGHHPSVGLADWGFGRAVMLPVASFVTRCTAIEVIELIIKTMHAEPRDFSTGVFCRWNACRNS